MQDNKTQGDFAFPQEWTVFGPVGKDDPEPDFEEMKDIPKELIVASKRLVGKKAVFTENRLDLGALPPSSEEGNTALALLDAGVPFPGALLGGSAEGITAHVMATIEADKDTEVELGAGADWWMKGRINR